jgi:Peptidase family M1 domain
MRVLPAVALLWAAVSIPAAAQVAPAAAAPDGIAALLRTLEQAIESGDPAQYVRLLSPLANREDAVSFAAGWFESGITRAVARERDRQPLAGTFPGAGYELNIDIFTEFGQQARLGTWRLAVRRTGDVGQGESEWQIGAQSEVSTIEGLYRLQLDPQKQFLAQNLSIKSEDFEIKMPLASLFVADVPDGTTAVVALGRGEMVFAPPIAAERRQVEIFSGNEVLQTRVDAAFVRLNPTEALDRISGTLEERLADPRDLRRATEFFETELTKSFALDLRDLSPQVWSRIPMLGDFVAEVHTARYDTLTYARLSGDPEDVSLFDRRRRRSISLYPSRRKLAERGPFYSEDDLLDYDVLDYDVESSFQPERVWIEGRTTIKLRTKATVVSNFRLRLARELTLGSVYSQQFGRLLALRELNQDNIIINLPVTVTQGTEIDVTVSYAGRLRPQAQTREAAAVDDQDFDSDDPTSTSVPREPNWMYSNNSNWYPQSTVSDYATARLHLAVPDGYEAIASGLTSAPSRLLPLADDAKGVPFREFSFVAAQPVRYLSWLISRFEPVDHMTVSIDPDKAGQLAHASGGPNDHAGFQQVDVLVTANEREVGRAHTLSPRAVSILQFYASRLGEFPYPSFTLAVVESNLPGGHSPPYFVQLKEPPAFTPFVWRGDPVYFSSFPDFFLAHELAHQWWGQAVGWKNFHEQWLSEGFAQYFALLYAEHQRPAAFDGILKQLRRWSVDESDQGPVYLGYRLGHIKNESRVFRALLYNKGAAVLHMLRRLVGDEAFFRSLRRFYSSWRFQKAGTEDLRAIFEVETHRPLDKFFAGWIYGQDIPQIRFGWQTDGNTAVLRFEQLGDATFVLPVTVSLQFADRTVRDQIVTIDQKHVDVRVPFTGTLRNVDVNRDDGALAEFVR